MFRAGLYARVSTNDQQPLAMQNWAMSEYAGRRGRTIALQVREVGPGAAKPEAREKLLEAARGRDIDVVLVWRLDRWGRSVTDLLAIFAAFEREVLGERTRAALEQACDHGVVRPQRIDASFSNVRAEKLLENLAYTCRQSANRG